MNGRFRLYPVLLLAVYLVGATVSYADTLHYRSGRKVEGKMIHINGYRLLFRLKNGKEIAVPASQIKRIQFSARPKKPAEPKPPARKPERQTRPEPKPAPKPPAKAERPRPKPPAKAERPAPKPTPPEAPRRTKKPAPAPVRPGTTTNESETDQVGPEKKQPARLFENVPPSKPIVQGPDKIMYARRPVKVTLAPESAGGGDTIYFKMGEAGFSKYAAPFVLARTGFYHIRYYGVDPAGNREVLRHKKIYVDRKAPRVALDFNGPRYTDRRGVTFVASPFVFVRGSDEHTGLAALRCKLNAEVLDLGAGGGAVSIQTKDEARELVCQARDRVGNQTDLNRHLYLDTVAPRLAWVSAPTGEMKTGARVAFQVEDKGSGLATLRLLVGGFAHELPLAARSFAPADYESKSGTIREFQILAIDRTGNEARTDKLRLRIDNKPPVSELKIAE